MSMMLIRVQRAQSDASRSFTYAVLRNKGIGSFLLMG